MKKEIAPYLSAGARVPRGLEEITMEKILPCLRELGEMMVDSDVAKSERVVKALPAMTKINMEGLESAYGPPEKEARR